eukprot:scaffold114480_cov22-Tisochrysis_lutea.AAC.1
MPLKRALFHHPSLPANQSLIAIPHILAEITQKSNWNTRHTHIWIGQPLHCASCWNRQGQGLLAPHSSHLACSNFQLTFAGAAPATPITAAASPGMGGPCAGALWDGMGGEVDIGRGPLGIGPPAKPPPWAPATRGAGAAAAAAAG